MMTILNFFSWNTFSSISRGWGSWLFVSGPHWTRDSGYFVSAVSVPFYPPLSMTCQMYSFIPESYFGQKYYFFLAKFLQYTLVLTDSTWGTKKISIDRYLTHPLGCTVQWSILSGKNLLGSWSACYTQRLRWSAMCELCSGSCCHHALILWSIKLFQLCISLV